MGALAALAMALAVMPTFAADNLCSGAAARAPGVFSNCTAAGGWFFSGGGDWHAKTQPDGRGQRFVCDKACKPPLTLDVEFVHGNEGIPLTLPFTPETYLARWNEKGLFDLAWLDSEDEALAAMPLNVTGREPFKAAEFRFKPGKPGRESYERLIAITYARDQLSLFKFTSAPDGLDRNRDRIASLLRSVEIAK
jgi:hypothetical protein